MAGSSERGTGNAERGTLAASGRARVKLRLKFEMRISKFETNSKYEIRMTQTVVSECFGIIGKPERGTLNVER